MATEEQIKVLKQKRDKTIAAKDAKWAKDIELLQKRIHSRIEYLDLGGGDKLAIRMPLSEDENNKIFQLMRLNREKDVDKINELTFEIVEIITANPLITKEWLKANPDKYATDDLLNIFIGYLQKFAEEKKEQANRLVSITSFRTK